MEFDREAGGTETLVAEAAAERTRTSSVASPGGLRAVAEFLAVLGIGILFTRAFAAEAYIVPTGSMAPTLLGAHRDLLCPNCGASFALGVDEVGQSGRPVCPNCGHDDLEGAPASEGSGDRLLVQKYLYDLRPPRRWEVAVFQNPEQPGEAFVKRVVGLPGESIEIRHGDILIDGHPARKSLAEQRGMRQLVYNHDRLPRDSDRFPRWLVRLDDRESQSRWRAEGSVYVRDSDVGEPAEGPLAVDWLEYRHLQPDRLHIGPIRDFVAYNGADGSENRVDDLMLAASVAVTPDCRSVRLRLGAQPDRLDVTIPIDGRGPVEVRRGGLPLVIHPAGLVLRSSDHDAPRFALLEASLFDRRLTVALDGQLLFEPIDFDEEWKGPRPSAAILALGVAGGSARFQGLKVYRDVYYTSALNSTLRRPFAVEEPYRLGEGEYFVLGDNSPVSNDSRFWEGSPVVRANQFLGKPFLVHLPSRSLPLQVFGGPIYWIPDPREIRYIR